MSYETQETIKDNIIIMNQLKYAFATDKNATEENWEIHFLVNSSKHRNTVIPSENSSNTLQIADLSNRWNCIKLSTILCLLLYQKEVFGPSEISNILSINNNLDHDIP